MRSLWIQRFLYLAFFTLLATGQTAMAQNEGEEDLTAAIDLRVNATSTRDLDEIADLCESALEKGLDDDGVIQANKLWASAWYEYAEQLSKQILRPMQARVKRWRIYRRQALTRLKKVIELQPGMSSAYLLFAELNSLEGGDSDAARDAIEKAIANITGDDEKLSKALFIRATLSDDDEAKLADLGQAIKIDPSNMDAFQLRGLYYLQHEQTDKAIDDFKAWLENDRENLKAYYTVARSMLAMKKFAEAEEILNQAIEVKPDVAFSYQERARIHLVQEDAESALADLGKAIKLDRRKAIPYLMMRAEIYRNEDRFDDALGDYSEVIELNTNNDELEAQALLQRSYVHSDKENFKNAIDDVKSILELSPGNILIKMQLGVLYNADEQPSKAIKIYDKLVQDLRAVRNRAPQDGRTAFLLSNSLRSRGDACLSLSRHKQAVADYSEALELQPENDGILNNLAWVLATATSEDVRDGKRAIELATKAAELTDHKAAHILSTLASGYAEEGDFENAIKWVSQALEITESDDQRKSLTKELANYKKGEPWRESQNVEAEKESGNQESKDEDGAEDADGAKGDSDTEKKESDSTDESSEESQDKEKSESKDESQNKGTDKKKDGCDF